MKTLSQTLEESLGDTLKETLEELLNTTIEVAKKKMILITTDVDLTMPIC